MARKVQPVDIHAAPSASDDETEDQDGSSSSTDDEQPPPQPQKSQNQQPQSEESDDSDSDDETEDDQPEPEPKPEPVVKKPSLQQPQESEESDDDSDETQNSPSASAFTVKPIVPKAASKSPEPKTPTSKPARVKSRAKRPADSEETDRATKPVSKNQEPGKVKGGNSKRPAEIETEKIDKVSKNKKSKVSNGDGQSDGKVEKGSKSKKGGDEEGGEIGEKKSIIKWSEEDEDALLGGMIGYKAETGDDVNYKVDAFFEYAKDLLSVNLTKSQLYEKIRRLKKKFQTNADKWQNGEEPVFSRPHENKLFELSQKIWGSEGTVTEGNDSKVKSSKKKDKKDGNVVSNTSTPLKPITNRELFVQEEVKDTIMEDKKEETQDFWSLYPRLCVSLESEASGYLTLRIRDLKEYVKKIISGMGEEKARELEEGWKAIHVMDHQVYAKRAHLINKQAEAVFDTFKYN